MPQINWKKAYEEEKAQQDRLFKMEQAAGWGEEKRRRAEERRRKRIEQGLTPDPPPGEELALLSWPFGFLVVSAYRLVYIEKKFKTATAILHALALFAVFMNPAQPSPLAANYRATLIFLAGQAAPAAAAAVGAAAGWLLLPLTGLVLAWILFAASLLIRGTAILLFLAVLYSTVAFLAGWPNLATILETIRRYL